MNHDELVEAFSDLTVKEAINLFSDVLDNHRSEKYQKDLMEMQGHIFDLRFILDHLIDIHNIPKDEVKEVRLKAIEFREAMNI